MCRNLIQKVRGHEKIQVLTRTLIVGFSGFKGNFTTEVIVGPGMYERKINHGAVILATGAKEYKPTEFLYGVDDRVVTQVELARRLADKGASDLNQVVMIQCVGSRNENNPNCSRICCQSAVKNALTIKKANPDAQVYMCFIATCVLTDFWRITIPKPESLGCCFSAIHPRRHAESRGDR
jgi:heterodisulfide reductase subunit A-like polyferredoxin